MGWGQHASVIGLVMTDYSPVILIDLGDTQFFPQGLGGFRDSAVSVIESVTPSNGSIIESESGVGFDVVDDGDISSCVVWADVAGHQEMVFDGDDFLVGYTSSTVNSLATGLSFDVRRDSGWTGSPTLRIVAVDYGGNVLSTSLSYVILVDAVAPLPAPSDVHVLARVDDHAAQAAGRLLEYYKLPRMQSFVGAIVALLQPLEDLCWELLEERYLDTINGNGPAVGVQLDKLGLIVGEARGNAVDDLYRSFIGVKIKINISTGKTEELYEILSLLGCEDTKVVELYPPELEIYATQVSYPRKTFDAMLLTKAAGVRIGNFVYIGVGDGSALSLSPIYDTETFSSTKGLASEYAVPPIGGYLSGSFIE